MSGNLAGALLMLLGMAAFALNDTIGKWLVADYGVSQVILLRSLAALDYPPAKLDIKLLIEADDPRMRAVRHYAEGTPAANPAFDVTPARLVTGLITERGRCEASEAGLAALYPEKA